MNLKENLDIIDREIQEKSEQDSSFETKDNVQVGLLGCNTVSICR
jgi:hypothetical protein